MMVVLCLSLAGLWCQDGSGLLVEGDLRLAPKASFLENPAVRDKLDSGLTATLQITVKSPPSDRSDFATGFRVDIRFEPWDEIYLVTLYQVHGGISVHQFESFDALLAWWRDPPLVLLPAQAYQAWRQSATMTSSSRTSTVLVELIPFSAQEQQRAREWLTAARQDQQSPSIQRIGPRRNSETRPLSEPGVMQVILSTSIRREAVYREKWTIRWL